MKTRILFRTKEKIIAFDLGEKGIQSEGLNLICNLDLHTYSHTPWDHFSPKVTQQLFNQTKAPLIAEPMIIDEMPEGIPSESVHVATPDKNIHLAGFEIVSAIGVHPRPITIFTAKWGEISIFHGADSGYVDLYNLKAKLAFVPTGSPSPSCSPENGYKMVKDIQPQVVIAMHGRPKQMQKFKCLLEKKIPGCSVIIPEIGEITRLFL